MRAAAWFAQDVPAPEIARRLRVSTNSTCLWRRQRCAGGVSALMSKGPGGNACRMSSSQLDLLRAALQAGPDAHIGGGSVEGQVAVLIGRLFHVRYTLRGTSYLLHRIGFSPQKPIHRAVERNEAAIAEWRTLTWAKVRG